VTSRFYFWNHKEAVFSFWPVRFIKGSDELGWHTFGIITWFGSIFYRYEKCTCPDVMNEYSKILDTKIEKGEFDEFDS